MKKTLLLCAFLVGLVSSNVMALTLDEARTQGRVGETFYGYLVALKTDAETEKLVADINAERKASYQQLAKQNNVSVDDIAKLAGQKLVAELSVLREHQVSRVSFRYHADVVRIAQNNRPRVKSVSTYRRHYHAGDVGRHDRASGRKSVSRRARRRRKYQPVGEEERKDFFPNSDLYVHDARQTALRYDQVVQRV